MVRGKTIVRRGHSAGEYQLRLLASRLQDPAEGLPLLLPRQSHQPCIHSHESLLSGQGKEPLELLLQELWTHGRHRSK
ncbi:UNVERIFIED_CONTAM: hypothetical protein Sangu_0969200 [Sesamum angustifolium]|uniref:Uncharacterized protein n=1 Tax=Sesamum angustifolium TaxID=2727405 RepID=A0AAW2PDG4_9LAMI